MSEGFIEPDLGFIAELKLRGGETLKKCYQCASCSVACDLTHDDKPFPRKEMIWAQWGLKDRLMSDPDVWLCHQCGDCSLICPRGAKPSSVLAAIRNASFRRFAFPGFMGAALSSPLYLPILAAVPVLLLAAALYSMNGFAVPEGTVVYSKFMPIRAIDSVFLPASLFSLVCAVAGVRRFWDGLVRANPLPADANIPSAIIGAAKEIITHERFAKCDKNRYRRLGHLMLFFGFVSLFITTNMVMAYHYLLRRETPLELLDPVKLLGNVGAVFAFVGCTWIIAKRAVSDEGSTHYDWTFVLALYLTVITGVLSELSRLAESPGPAYPVYFFHLTLVFFLIVYMPFSKFAHMLYRATAMVHSMAAQK
ncbi:MAG: quinone-interacting membrane-bound oxidoreductase complex subunit QmoC [Nitrospinae bacterium]|nr:quinone-interacting membrane-bound oxidoreductase complex subunit QmoC [Nitrospinota bacterium]